MNSEQISALWRAAQEAGLTAEQIRGLSICNPYSQRGPVSQRIQSALGRARKANGQFVTSAEAATNSIRKTGRAAAGAVCGGGGLVGAGRVELRSGGAGGAPPEGLSWGPFWGPRSVPNR